MQRFTKHNKRSAEGTKGLPNNFPSRSGRRVIRSSAPLLKEDYSSRKLDDFSQPSGYNPSQPLVTGRLVKGGKEIQESSMLNMSVPAKEKETETLKPKKKIGDRLRMWVRLTEYFLASLVVIAVVTFGILLVKGDITHTKLQNIWRDIK